MANRSVLLQTTALIIGFEDRLFKDCFDFLIRGNEIVIRFVQANCAVVTVNLFACECLLDIEALGPFGIETSAGSGKGFLK